jgi:cytoskeletal protein CcmA (bactofilin family)
MALQIRRGTNNERLLMNGIANPVPAQGELLYVTDRKKLFIGDGTTTGGASAGYFGAIAVSGQNTIFSSGINESLTIVAGDNISITTNENTNAITINAAAQFDEINNGSIRLSQNNIAGLNSNENINIDPAGTGKVVITGALDVSGTISGNLTGNVTGNVTGTVSGNAGSVTNGVYLTDVGSVTSIMLAGNISNSKLLNSNVTVGTTSINLGASSTTLAGLTSVTSTAFTGNIFTNLIDSADSSQIVVTPTMRFNSDVTFDERVYADRFFGSVTGNVTGNVVGNVLGNVNGDVVGNVTGADIIANKNISLSGSSIITTETNDNLYLRPNGSGRVDIEANLITNGIEIFGPGTGGNSGNGSVFVATTSPSAVPLSIAEIHNTASLTGGVSFARARGSLTAQTIVQNGDEIQSLAFSGYDGATFIPSATIQSIVNGAPSSGRIPGKLSLKIANALGVLASRLDIEATKITSNVPFKVVSYADATARDTAITSPEAGMMVFLTGTSKFSGYNGAAWNDLN